MATIRVDRGFTQKIQQNVVPGASAPKPPPGHKESKPAKRKSGPSGAVWALVAAGAVVLVVAVVGVVIATSGNKSAPPKAAVVEAPAAQPAPAPVAAPQPPPAKPAAAAKPPAPSIRAKVKTGFSSQGANFTFDGVPRPAENDAASSARFSLVDTSMDRNSGGPSVLNDGRVPSGVDQPRNCFSFKKGSGGGRLLVDLGRTVAVRQVNTYSWHSGKRGPQVYTVYGGDDEATEFVVDPGRGVDPVGLGWRRLAEVDTRPQSGSWAGQYGASVSAETGTLGSYRFLLFVAHAVGPNDENENTSFCEIDVVDSGSTATPVEAKAADSAAQFGDREVALGSQQGLLCEYYDSISGNVVDDLRRAPKYPSKPDWALQVKRFELPEKLGEQYGARVRGYVIPPKSGAYTFVLNVDDGGEFWLSTDESPTNLKKLIGLTKHTARKWNAFAEQQSVPCELVAGQRYYLEAFVKQAAGQEYLAVGWFGPVSEQVTIIDGQYLQPWKGDSN